MTQHNATQKYKFEGPKTSTYVEYSPQVALITLEYFKSAFLSFQRYIFIIKLPNV